MKKLLAVVLLLALLLPVASLADDADMIGCWTTYSLQKNGAPVVSSLYLSENYVSYYVIQSFSADDVGIGRTYIGTWSKNADGSVTAKTGENTEITLVLSPRGGAAMNPRTSEIYVNLKALLE